MTYLDPRPARPLTSREIAKVLGALIGAAQIVLGKEECRAIVRQTHEALLGNVNKEPAEENARDFRVYLSGLVGASIADSGFRATERALAFWSEQEKPWEALEPWGVVGTHFDG